MRSTDVTTLVHLLGFLTGIALYAMLGWMTLRTRRARGGRSEGADRIPLATAALGLLWNVGALATYGARDLGLAPPPAWVTALAVSSLGFLPAVVVQAAAQGLRPMPGARALVLFAYALSALAAMFQTAAALTGSVAPWRPALLALTGGFGVLVLLLAARMRGQPGWRRALAVAALAAFAVTALHVAEHVENSGAWPLELIGHHASLALALAILYQDYRFALADLFLKRVLTLLALLALALVVHAAVAPLLVLPLLERDVRDARVTGVLVALSMLTALAFPALRRLTHRFVERTVLRRPDYASVRGDAAARIAAAERPEAVLDVTTRTLAEALGATRADWCALDGEGGAAGDSPAPLALAAADGAQQLRARVVTAERPSFEIRLGDLAGGRRLLSDDLALVEHVALTAGRRIDAIRTSQERLERSLREREILQLAAEAELRALQAQLNPHFLFNALTTLGYLMQSAPDRAMDTLYRLTGLLRAVLRRSEGEFTTLGEELEIVESYLAIERARFEERLGVEVDVPPALRALRVPPLVLQPVVENAVKHGIAPRREGGRVAVRGRQETGADGAVLVLTVSDTGVGVAPAELARRRARGIGLSNVERRLTRHFGDRAALAVRSAPGEGTTVEVRIPVGAGAATPVEAAR